MSLAPGARLGPYEIVAAIGAGGMGEVYRARDMKLGRDVALKTLPDHFAADRERVLRFEREAHLLATLNHPNIAAIYGWHETPADAGVPPVCCIAMELVDGESLADRLRRGAMPPDEALAVVRQMIDALETANERGIVHRDLKPANIMLTPDGQVKILDFGLAKAFESPSAPNAANSPTLSLAATQAGVILGTAAYMSPEQAKGRAADKRSDVWAFGCVWFEMLTGKRAFEGEDVTETLAAIVRGEPDWQPLSATAAPKVIAIIKRCLTKDRKARIPDVSVVRFMLDDTAVVGTAPMVRRAPRPLVRAHVAFSTTGSLVYIPGPVTSVGGLDIALIDRKGNVEPFRLAPGSYESPRVSPDGRRVAFQTAENNEAIIWIYEVGGGRAMQRLSFGGNNRFPVWSADSTRVIFQSDREGDLAFRPSGGPHEMVWSPDGKELFYNPAPGTFEVVSVSTVPTFAFGRPANVARPFQLTASQSRRAYDMAPDGRFVGLITPVQAQGQTSADQFNRMIVVLNWFEELKQRVGTRN